MKAGTKSKVVTQPWVEHRNCAPFVFAQAKEGRGRGLVTVREMYTQVYVRGILYPIPLPAAETP